MRLRVEKEVNVNEEKKKEIIVISTSFRRKLVSGLGIKYALNVL